MQPYQDPEFAGLSTEDLVKIDQVVSQYETLRRSGESIEIDGFIATQPPAIHPLLHRELVGVEAEILGDWGDATGLARLAERWPGYTEFIRSQALASTSEATVTSEALSSTISNRSTAPRMNETDSVAAGSDWNKRFVIRAELAEGGLGQLFVAHDLELDRDVAIKVLKRQFSSRPDMLLRFQAEATVTSHLEHPNIVPVYARGSRPCGQPYFAMRLIKGQSLKALIKDTHAKVSNRQTAGDAKLNFRSDPAARDLLVRLITVCRAMAYAHHCGWVHRDLKPSNIMVGSFGETVIIDWGLAARIGDAERSRVGTAGYMSPEQSKGLVHASQPATDIYSLGCILFCILTNLQPDVASIKSTIAQAGQALTTLPPAALRHAREQPAVPGELDAICRKATALGTDHRYENAESLADDLEAWLADEPTSVLKETRYQRLRRRLRSNPAIAGATLGAVAASFAALLILLAVVTRGNASLKQANAREQAQTQLAQQATTAAQTHASVAEQAQQRLMELLRSFVMDVEQELAKVPGSSSVRRQILTTSLNQLSQVVQQFGDDAASAENRALAWLSAGDLFLRFGKQDLKLDVELDSDRLDNPADAASHLFQKAEQSVDAGIAGAKEPDQTHRLKLIKCKALQRRVEGALIKGDLASASTLADASLRLAAQLEAAQKPDAATHKLTELMNWWAAVECCGRVWRLTGQPEQLVELMQEAVTKLDAVNQEHSAQNEVARALGMAHVFLGDAAFEARDLLSAKHHYEADLAVSEMAFKQQPAKVITRKDLAVSLDRVGNIHQRQGEVEKSIEIYERSLAIRQELHVQDSQDQTFLRDLFVSHMKVGDAHMLIKQVDDAAKRYESANELSQKMVAFDSKNVNARRYQSMCAEVLADVCIARGQLDEALRHAEQSLAASLAIEEIQPANVQAVDDVLLGYLKVAKVYQAMQDWEKTIGRVKIAIELADREATRRGAPSTYQAFTRLKLAEALQLSNDAAAARDLCLELIPRINAIVEKSRQDSVWRRRQYQVFTMLGQAELALNEKDAARQAFQSSLEYARAMIKDGQRVETVQKDADAIELELEQLPIE